LPFSKLAPYCLTANFSTAASKPKNECTISDAFCSKHVQSGFSGCSCAQRMLRCLHYPVCKCYSRQLY
jgi:hypothetical protein